MRNDPIENDLLREAMEAYRPGTDDLGDPQFAVLARQLAADPHVAARLEKLGRLDAAVRESLQDVPVPAGLAQRLLDRLALAREEKAGRAPVSVARRRRPHLARWVVGVAGAVAAALIVAVLLQTRGAKVLSEATVIDQAVQLFTAEPPMPGQLLAETPAPPDFPLSHDVLKGPQVRWRWVEGFLGGKAVVYELSEPGGGRAILCVARRDLGSLLPSIPPTAPTPTTAGCSAAAWQEEGTLYVLVVEGDARAYRSFLDLSRGPLT